MDKMSDYQINGPAQLPPSVTDIRKEYAKDIEVDEENAAARSLQENCKAHLENALSMVRKTLKLAAAKREDANRIKDEEEREAANAEIDAMIEETLERIDSFEAEFQGELPQEIEETYLNASSTAREMIDKDVEAGKAQLDADQTSQILGESIGTPIDEDTLAETRKLEEVNLCGSILRELGDQGVSIYKDSDWHNVCIRRGELTKKKAEEYVQEINGMRLLYQPDDTYIFLYLTPPSFAGEYMNIHCMIRAAVEPGPRVINAFL